MSKKTVNKVETKKAVVKYVPIDDPFALETVEVVKQFGNHRKGSKIEGHPNTLIHLKNKGLVK